MNGRLKAAHRGYRYQDIATAYVLVRSMVDRYDQVIVDCKQVKDDNLDDLEVVKKGQRIRRQFKSSQDPNRPLKIADFTGERSSLRMDKLVLTHVRGPAHEYRLCATWQPPSSDDELLKFLEDCSAEPTFEGGSPSFFQLRGGEIWPEGMAPIWTCLAVGREDEFDREDFLEFCKRFVIEISLPQTSTDLTTPKEMESALVKLLADGVGIGRYPNHDRNPDDVAALAISLANLARTKELSLIPADVERNLVIRTDFGRVSQSFPVDASKFHNRPNFRGELLRAAIEGKLQLVVGQPGAGKSWELTRLSEELEQEGAIVARHYCYLEPGDDLVEQRITTNTLFGNLLAELVDGEPALLDLGGARYSAGLRELEDKLVEAAKLDRPVVLIVDGLDHIARVQADAFSLSDGDVDIVDRLATLNIPTGVGIIIGSQPGEHLRSLHEWWGDSLVEHQLPAWDTSDIKALARRHGVEEAMNIVGITEQGFQQRILDVLADRADGNPLYTRYLSHGLAIGLKSGNIIDPVEWLENTPALAGDIAEYYAYLYSKASQEAQGIADVLGVIDFSVSEEDLREIFPAFMRGFVKPALDSLKSVLTITQGQGGVRIFHESFRRFMKDELMRQGRSLGGALEPVISWLVGRGLFKDARSYRFLLPALRRAGRGSEVLEHVSTTFVSDSLAYAHPLQAIEKNIALAADVAASSQNWPVMVRCAELHRSAYTAFEEIHGFWGDYWNAYLDLFGVDAFAERLIFDGRVMRGREDGLMACQLIDDAGGTAPWREYLELRDDTEFPILRNMPDDQDFLVEDERLKIAVLQGRLRLGDSRIIGRVVRYLRSLGGTFRTGFVRQVAARLARMHSTSLVERIAALADYPSEERKLSPKVAAVLRLGLADEYKRLGNFDAAAIAANQAVEHIDSPELAIACLFHGAAYDACVQHAILLSDIDIFQENYDEHAVNVFSWVSSARLFMNGDESTVKIVKNEYRRLFGPGWYRCWLKFVLEIASVEAAKRKGEKGDIEAAFKAIIQDIHPFTGKPRACDLYQVERIIYTSIQLALSFLEDEDDWKQAISALLEVCAETGTRYDCEDGGPLRKAAVLDLLLPHVSTSRIGAIVRAGVEKQAKRFDKVGTYYPTHADFAMRLARARKAAGDEAAALEAWHSASRFLAAYGFHKDITLFDLIESAPSSKALQKCQCLTNSVLRHTDLRETRNCPNAWFGRLIEFSPVQSVMLLAQTIVEDDGIDGWMLEGALQDVAKHILGDVDPVLIDALLSSLNFEVEHESEAVKEVDLRLAPVLQLVSDEREETDGLLARASAEILNDSKHSHQTEIYSHFNKVVDEKDLCISYPPVASEELNKANSRQIYDRERRKDRDTRERISPFPQDASMVGILAGLRSGNNFYNWEDPTAWDEVVLSLGYILCDFAAKGREEDSKRVLRFIARDITHYPSAASHPLSRLAESMENAGYIDLATIAYVLAYTSSRGGGGWLNLGGSKHSAWMDRAIQLDRELALRTISDEIGNALKASWYPSGLSRNLIKRVSDWGDESAANKSWDEIFAVVAHRLPLSPNDGGPFASFECDNEFDWTLTEALIAVLLARMAEPRISRKFGALGGIAWAFKNCPQDVIKPFGWWLSHGAHMSSVLILFNVLNELGRSTDVIVCGVSKLLELYAAGDSWGASKLAGILLERVGLRIPRGKSCFQEFEDISDGLSGRVCKIPEGLAETWPELQNYVSGRWREIWYSGEYNSEHGRSVRELAIGRDGDANPPTPVLSWEKELYITALNDQLTGLSEYLWKQGRWSTETEEEVLASILPKIKTHLGVAASRVPRPNHPKPVTCSSGENELFVIDDNSTYHGWTRLALFERQYYTNSSAWHSKPTEVVTVFSGAIVKPIGLEIPEDAFPFCPDEFDGWWSNLVQDYYLGLPVGPLVPLERVSDWLCDSYIFFPPPILQSRMWFSLPAFGAPLMLKDRDMSPAVVFRSWRVRGSWSLWTDPAEFLGCDLIIRPDLMKELSRISGGAIVDLWKVSRKAVQ